MVMRVAACAYLFYSIGKLLIININQHIYYLSMWNGYLNPKCAAFNKDLASSLCEEYEYMHTSGHCDMESLKGLIEQLSPKGIIPIHTDNPNAFAQCFSYRWPVVLLNDGETYTCE